jgi:hypothetical protein
VRGAVATEGTDCDTKVEVHTALYSDGLDVAARAVAWGLAPADDRAELIAFRGAGNVMRGHHWDDIIFALDILRSDLESIEIEASTAGFEPGVAEGIEYLEEGNEDGAAIFEDGSLRGSSGARAGLAARVCRRVWK